MSQSTAASYGYSLDVAQAGQLAGLDYGHIESFAAEGAVPFGRGVIFGTDATKQVAVPADATGTFAGIAAAFTHAQQQGIDSTATEGGLYSTGTEYSDTDTVNVVRRNRVYVELTADGVTAGETAYVDVTTAGEEGKFTNAADDGTNNNLQTGGVFRTGGDTGDLAIVELNLP
jgi:hypothetical protein